MLSRLAKSAILSSALIFGSAPLAQAQQNPQIPANAGGSDADSGITDNRGKTPASGLGRYLGSIKEQSPLIAPPSSDLFGAPLNSPSGPRKPARTRQINDATDPNSPVNVIADYPLNEAVLAKLEKIHGEIINLADTGDDNDSDEDISGGVDVLVKAMEKSPDVMEILGRNLMSARDYVTGMQAAANALAAASGVGGRHISPDNKAFGQKYADRIRAMLEQ